MSSPSTVLAFDIGIRNLAWCLLRKGTTAGDPWTILGWENYDLLSGMATQDAKAAGKIRCGVCQKVASFETASGGPTCQRHCPESRPPLRDASGVILKRIPALPVLRAVVEQLQAGASKKRSKEGLLAVLRERVSLPIVPTKLTKRQSEDLTAIHDSLRAFVAGRAELFRTANWVLLENQPAFKNPTMKSVQMLLFASLREALVPLGNGVTPTPVERPWIGFVHAGKKVQGAAKGDAGYTERKKGSEERVREFFEKEPLSERERWVASLAAQQKKSDLCDALCMCLDRHALKTV